MKHLSTANINQFSCWAVAFCFFCQLSIEQNIGRDPWQQIMISDKHFSWSVGKIQNLRSEKLQLHIASKRRDKESHTHLEHKLLTIHLNKHKGVSCKFFPSLKQQNLLKILLSYFALTISVIYPDDSCHF